MRILFTLHHELDPDTGAAGATLQLASSLRDLGHQVEIFGSEHVRPRLDDRLDSLLFPPVASVRILRELRGGHVDIVDASTGDLWPIPRRVVAASRAVVVARSHGLEHIAHRAALDAHARGELHLSRRYPVYYGGIRLWQVSRTLRSADAVLFLNTEEREYAIENLRVRRAGTRIVQNGIPSELLNLPWRETPSQDAPIGVALVGSYSWRKGAPVAVAVLSQTLRTEPRLKATWLGTGASADEVRRSFPSDVRDRLTVVPCYERPALAPLLRDSHLLLFPSRSEGFSLALVEAMACGLAPVVSDIGGAHDLLSGGSAGVLVSPGDASGFASTLDRLIHDRNLLDSMRRSASDLAQSYSWNAIARTLAMSYQDLLKKKASQREAVTP